MAQEIRPQDTTRASSYELWMKAPNPMVTFILLRWLKHAGTGIYQMIAW